MADASLSAETGRSSTDSVVQWLRQKAERFLSTLVSRPEHWVLLGILACAFGVRAWYVSSGVPYAVGVDEPAIVDRALRILRTGDWNPHGFDYPSLVIYLQAAVTFGLLHVGALWGQGAERGLDIGAVYEAGRLVAALLGTATVWLTYRLGKDLDSGVLGLVAAAQLAVFPMHVRESHFTLTDVPTTAFVTLALYLAVRALRERTVSAYGWAGCAAGLAAAAKYNGAVVAVAIGLAWLLNERSAPDRWRKALAALIAIIVAFVVTVPYVILDRPAFLKGFGAQVWRFSSEGGATPSVPPWQTYLIHLSLAWRFWLPTAALGALIVLWQRRSLKSWFIPIGFVMAYFYVLATHRVVFGRYALPLLPGICLLAAVPVVELSRFVQRRLTLRFIAPAFVVLGTVTLTAAFASDSLAWLDQFRRPDTRTLAARWMVETLPWGTRLVVENGGPANLEHVGFNIADNPNRLTQELLDSYRKTGIEYFVIAPWSSTDLPGYGTVLDTGNILFSIDSADDRWGPFVRVVKLSRAN